MKARTLTLTSEQRQALEAMRDRDPKPYRRERAAGLLKISDGASPHAVATHGLFKPRKPDTLYAWLDRYQDQGLPGLTQRPRRRRFSPL